MSMDFSNEPVTSNPDWEWLWRRLLTPEDCVADEHVAMSESAEGGTRETMAPKPNDSTAIPARGDSAFPILDAPEARRDRLAAENSYLMARLIEMEANLNETLAGLNVAIEQLCKIVTPNTLPRMLTVPQVAALYQVAERTVNGWVHEGRVPFHRPGGAVRFKLDELLAWSGTDDTRSTNVVALARSKRLQPGRERNDAR